MEFLVLEVDDARFGVPTLDVREVVRAASLGAAPARFPNMLGILNYRGQILGVLELDCLQGPTHRRATRELTPHDHLIVLQTSDHLFALRVDRAVEILALTVDETPTDIAPVDEPATNNAYRAVSHPRLGVVHLLDAGALWAELHAAGTNLPTQEVEVS